MQAMDASHVALVSLNMGMDLFEDYRCDVPIQLGNVNETEILFIRCFDDYSLEDFKAR